ncbi:MAG: hypothetical protein WKG07_15855 [Hymenobacter sp.]
MLRPGTRCAGRRHCCRRYPARARGGATVPGAGRAAPAREDLRDSFLRRRRVRGLVRRPHRARPGRGLAATSSSRAPSTSCWPSRPSSGLLLDADGQPPATTRLARGAATSSVVAYDRRRPRRPRRPLPGTRPAYDAATGQRTVAPGHTDLRAALLPREAGT